MPTDYRVEFELSCGDWRRGRSKDIATEFNDARADTGRDDSIIVANTIPSSELGYVPDKWEAYRLARNRVEAKLKCMGEGPATFSNVDVEKVERDVESIENPTIDDAKNWAKYDEADTCDWVHEPTHQWLAIKEDGPNVREDWHSDSWCEKSPWVVVHKFTSIGRYETEEEAREAALGWMVGNPYGLDPADSYM